MEKCLCSQHARYCIILSGTTVDFKAPDVGSAHQHRLESHCNSS